MEFDYTKPHKLVDGVPVYLDAEEILELEAKKAVGRRQLVIDQIQALEALITPRRLREFLRGADEGWLESIDDQIIDLRQQLN